VNKRLNGALPKSRCFENVHGNWLATRYGPRASWVFPPAERSRMSITPIDATETNSIAALTSSKFTADQIETDCPARLQEIGRAAADQLAEAENKLMALRQQMKKRRKQFAEAEKQTSVAQNLIDAVSNLVAEAKELCDADGFDAFRQKFFPKSSKLLEPIEWDAAVDSLDELAKCEPRDRGSHPARAHR
jgi:hypothetical protein